MKLLFHISSLRAGGAERVMSILCNELTRRGHEVHLSTNLRYPFAYTIDERIQLHELMPDFFLQKKRFLRHAEWYRLIRKTAKTINPDIIISFIHGLNVHILFACLGLTIPIVLSERTTFRRKLSKIDDFIRFYLNRFADKLVILTQADYDVLGDRMPNKVIIPNPLSFPIYSGIGMRRKSIIAIGSIDRWEPKGFGLLIKICGNIFQSHEGWTLQIVGGGREENFDKLKKIASQYNVAESVSFLGLRKDVDKILQESSIYALTSRFEGFPMALVEAMSQGCACVSFNCPSGPSEIITNDYDGLLVKNQDAIALEEKLSLLIQDKELRNRLASNARKSIERFSVDKVLLRWEELFYEVLSKK
jgi:glycosyltransferase involved in cell wall biosynthesis